MSAHRVVFQLARAEPAFHHAVLRNIRNVAAELDDVAVCVIAHGEGIEFATGSTVGAQPVDELMRSGAELLACGNTLRRKEIPEARLVTGVRVVPAGLAELVRRQHDGWAYIHP